MKKELCLLFGLLAGGCTSPPPDNPIVPYPIHGPFPTEIPSSEAPLIRIESDEVMLSSGIIVRPSEICISPSKKNVTSVVFNMRIHGNATKDRTNFWITPNAITALGIEIDSHGDLSREKTKELFEKLKDLDATVSVFDNGALRSFQAFAASTHLNFKSKPDALGGIVMFLEGDIFWGTDFDINSHYDFGFKPHPEGPAGTYINDEGGITDVIISASSGGDDFKAQSNDLNQPISCMEILPDPTS